MHAYGLFDERECLGVVTYSLPTSPRIIRSVVDERCAREVLELSRLALSESAGRNGASMLVGRSLRLIPRPKIIVSYADAEVGHIGYVYQATNFLYCGQGPGTHYIRLKTGEMIHPRSITSTRVSSSPKTWARENGHEVVETSGKHRYAIILGDKKQKRELREAFRWVPQAYPKGDTTRHNVDAHHPTQETMF